MIPLHGQHKATPIVAFVGTERAGTITVLYPQTGVLTIVPLNEVIIDMHEGKAVVHALHVHASKPKPPEPARDSNEPPPIPSGV